MGRRRLSSVDMDDGDRLLDTIRVIGALDTLDSMDRRDQQSAMEAKQMDMRLKEFQLNETQEARLASQQKFNVEQQIGKNIKEARSNSALAVINQQLPNLDFNNPEHEAQYGKLKALAKENFVDDQGIQSTFGMYDEVMGRKKAEQNTIKASEIGEEGRAVYDALLESSPGLDTAKALRLVKKSANAQATYLWWQNYANEKGVDFAPDDTELASLTKKIGWDNSTPVPLAGGGNNLQQAQPLDLREEVWDMQAVNKLVAKYITPKLKIVEDARAKVDARAVEQAAATLANTQANAEQSRASANKTKAETEILKATRPEVYSNKQALQGGSDKDRPRDGTTMPTIGSQLFAGPTPAPAPAPTPPR